MSHTQLLDAIIQKKKEKKSPRRIGNALFKTIVEMAYEMKYANRYCEAERSNRFVGMLPTYWNHNVCSVPFEVIRKDYTEAQIGDIVVEIHFRRDKPWGTCCRIAKVVKINRKSLSLADCDQDGQVIQYNPDSDTYWTRKEDRKNYNKVYKDQNNVIDVITGTKHLRYHGWDS
jgi:hypothetical protein